MNIITSPNSDLSQDPFGLMCEFLTRKDLCRFRGSHKEIEPFIAKSPNLIKRFMTVIEKHFPITGKYPDFLQQAQVTPCACYARLFRAIAHNPLKTTFSPAAPSSEHILDREQASPCEKFITEHPTRSYFYKPRALEHLQTLKILPVKQFAREFYHLFNSLPSDAGLGADLIEKALQLFPNFIDYIPEELWSHSEFVLQISEHTLKATELSPRSIYYTPCRIPDKLWGNTEFAQKAIRLNPDLIHYVPESLRKNLEFKGTRP